MFENTTIKCNEFKLLLSKMRIFTIMLKESEHKLAHPIDISEEDYLSLAGKRMIKMYNTTFGLLGYGTDLDTMRECMVNEVNLIINSYLFDPTYIPDKPMLDGSLILRNEIMRHVYG